MYATHHYVVWCVGALGACGAVFRDTVKEYTIQIVFVSVDLSAAGCWHYFMHEIRGTAYGGKSV